MKDYKQVALVTGGNRGIGGAIVQGLAQDDKTMVLLGCRKIKDGQKIAQSIGSNVLAVHLDLSEARTTEEDMKQIVESFPNINILINNAALLHEGDYTQLSPKDFAEALRVNTVAPYELIHLLIPQMIATNFGRIVNISSGWGAFSAGLQGPLSYAVSKAALNALTVSVSATLPSNVKINSMCPGWVRTRMGGPSATRSPEQGAETALWLARLPADGPSGQFFRDKRQIEW